MRKRITRIWSLVLAITLVASMSIFAVPASADYGNMQFTAQPLPTVTGLTLAANTDVTAMAQSTDGMVIYIADNEQGKAAALYKSTDGGKSFVTTNVTGAAALTGVAIAPDNSDVVAATDNQTVYITSNGGSTWSALPAVVTTNLTNTRIMDLGVGPARSGTLLGREYAVALSSVAVGVNDGNPHHAQNNTSDVKIIGNTAAWSSIFPPTQGNTTSTLRDWVAVKFTPNFVGDRTLVCLGAGATGGNTNLVVAFINTTLTPPSTPTTAAILNTLMNFTPLNPTGGTSTATDFSEPGAATSLMHGSIALPIDFDATNPSGRRAYVGLYTKVGAADNDVYRVDDNQGQDLGATTSTGVYSVAYGGTVDSGTLFMGATGDSTVKWTTQATSSLPTWTTTKKLMPLTTTKTLVMTATNFATSNKIFAGTTGADSAFSVSTDGGISFNGQAIIDYGATATLNTVGVVTFVHVSGDGKFGYVTTKVGATGNISLWKTSLPSSSSTWQRLYVTAPIVAAGSGTVRLSPDFATTNTIYFFDLSIGGQIYRSTDGGAIFNTRQPPNSNVAISSIAILVVDSNTLFVGETGTSPSFYKSTAGAFTWNTGVAPNVGTIRQIAQPKPDHVFVGGDGFIAYSTDGGVTFPAGEAGVNTAGRITGDPTERYRVVASPKFATDNTLFLADALSTGRVYRYILGTDTALVDLINPSSNTTGITRGFSMRAGALYVCYGAGAAPNNNRIDRTLNPYGIPGTTDMNWTSTVPVSPTTGLTFFAPSAPSNVLWVFDGTTVWAYNDSLATAKPVLTAPADNYNLQIDPITGRADQIGVIMKAMGSGTGLVTHFQIRIWEKSAGVGAATIFPFTIAAATPGIAVGNPSSPEVTLSNTGTLNINGVASTFPALAANKVYQFQMRASAESSTALLDSVWSDARTINVQSGGAVIGTQFGPQLLGPTGGAQNVSQTPGFAWAPLFGTSKYKFVLATDGAMTKTVAGTPVNTTLPSFQVTTALEYSTTYFWSVQSIEPTIGPVSVGTFTTIAKPAPPPAPVTVAPAPAPTIIVTVPPAPPTPVMTPAYIWAVIAIGAVLVIAVIILIVRTRRPM